MRLQILKVWDSLHSSYWFVPSLMTATAIALAVLMLTIDRKGISGPVEEFGWVYAGGPDGARMVLSTIAGSMITVAGTVFSITIVALSLASSQFGPRLLRNFMRDTGNQVVLGTFIATFLYCLLILRTVRGEDNDLFVPQVSVTFGVVLAIADLGVLIYFIHHAAKSIQADHVVAEVGQALNQAIDRRFPQKLGRSSDTLPQRDPEDDLPANFDQDASSVNALGSGYLQAIDDPKLIQIAKTHQLLIRLQYHPGNYVVKGSDLVMVWPGKRVTPKLTKQVNAAFVLGVQRTEQQDAEFAVDQLVEIAVRALSPGINDPFTAIRCIDQLTASLCRLAVRNPPSPYRYDDDHILRVIAQPLTFTDLTDAAFNQIRQYGSSDVAVVIRLLEAIAAIAARTQHPQDRATLVRHARMIKRVAEVQISEQEDRQDIEERYWAALRALQAEA